MTINLGATQEVRFATGTTARTHSVTGDLNIQGGIVVGSNGSSAAGSATVTIGGKLNISGGTFRGTNDVGDATFNIAGNIVNGGTWQQDDGTSTGIFTINLNGGTAQDISSANAISFERLTIDNSSGATLSRNVDVTSLLRLTAGDLDTGANTLTMPVAATSAGTTDVVGNVLRTGFVTGGSALSFGNPFNTIAVTSGTAPANILVNLVKGTPDDFANAVRRTYTITPSASGFTGTLRLHYNDSELNGNTEADLVLWRNSSTWTNQGGTVTDDMVNDNNFVQVAGVTQFSPWTISGPSAPTAVKLTKFGAMSFADGVQLNWESGFEVDNLGYQLYREQKNQRTRLTPAVVAGSALTVGPGSRLTAGYSYSWFDPKGNADTSYYLEAIDLNGRRQWTGPIYPYASASDVLSPRQQRALLLNEIATKSGATNISLANTSDIGWPAAMNAEARSETLKLTPQSLATQQEIAARQAVKIQVRQSGWYRITQPELVAAGFDPSTDARLLQLYVDGAEVPIALSSSGARLNTNATLEFYGVALDIPTTDTRVYWLINGSSAGKRINGKGDRWKLYPSWKESTARSFDYTTERREKVLYFSNLLNGDAENIFGAPVLSEPVSQTLTVRNLDTDAATSGNQAQLEVALQGLTEGPHQVQLQINGAQVGTITFGGREHPVQKFSINRSLLREGDNAVSLLATAGDSDISLIDWIRLTYAHQYRADNNTLRFSVPGGQTVRVGGFTTPNVRVLDITNPNAPLEVGSVAGYSGGGYAVTVAAGNNARTLLAFADDRAGHPAAVAANKPSNWNAATNAADMVIITHKNFRQAIEPLAALRRSQGLSVAVVDVEDVYDEFSYGAHTPLALKSFLSWAAGHWSHKPGYLLLVGDSSWDPRNYLDQGENDFVPTKLIDTSYMETGSDDWLADFNDVGLANMAIGRLPGRAAAEVNLMVSKILSYEQERELNAPLRGAVMVADSGFQNENTQTRALLPSDVAVQTINRDDVGNDDLMRGQIVDALNSGPMIVNYYGHGSVRVWTGASLLDSDLAGSLTNTNRLSLYVLMTCLNGYAHDAYVDSLGESALKAQNGGAVAVWASSGFTDSQPQFDLDSEFYRLLFGTSGSSPLRLGEAIRGAKAAISDRDVRRTWTLLGDPAMRVK
jgi:hypothetical protein